MKKIVVAGVFSFMLLTIGCQQQPFTSLSPQKYRNQQHQNTGVVVDVRTPAEFNTGHLANAQNSDWRSGQFVTDIKQWDKEKTYYLYCATGNRSGQAMQLMKEAGFKKVYNLGGYKELKAAGLLVEEE